MVEAPVVIELEAPQGDIPPASNAPLDARLYVKSCIKYKNLPRIRRDYYVPLDYTLYIPNNDQSMHQPLPGCFTVHLPLLDAGLRFPLDPHVATLINHLRISPSQLAPDALRNILCYVILMQYFGHEPSISYFSALFCASSSTRSQTPGFCYVNARRNIRFVGNLPSSARSWKDKLLFVRAPANRPWNVSTNWSFHKPSLKHVRQEELVVIARAARVEVDLDPIDVPPTPHAGDPNVDPSSAHHGNNDRQSPGSIGHPLLLLMLRLFGSRSSDPAPKARAETSVDTRPRKSQKGKHVGNPSSKVPSPSATRAIKAKRSWAAEVRSPGPPFLWCRCIQPSFSRHHR
ncbi:hypothetical protein Salat_0127200 [Sesamum alatum]|uniref:Transposase (putative) gypsy type domain-containing protein n=1 Tax=Sesamum alatum TaxID=300844 RepID=A0AAE2CX62_9LAMI|nr:hypothetical protein Salat_0127200 [Sesamum alatum]